MPDRHNRPTRAKTLVVVCLAAFTSAGCGGDEAAPPDPFALLRARPLDTSLVDCERPALRPSWADAVGVGSGPLYGTDDVVAAPGSGDRRANVPARTLSAGEVQDLQVPTGTLVQKVLWAFKPDLTPTGAAILIRGAAVGHMGAIFPGAEIGVPLDSTASEIRITVPEGSAGRFTQPSLTFVTKPGCYVYQVDGARFTAQIAMRYQPEGSDAGRDP